MAPEIKILHTSDWHLGKKYLKKSFLAEQKYFLCWLQDIIIQKSIDVLVVAGDIFDTPAPPIEAQKIYYHFLKSVTAATNCHILIIAGNHDGGHFLEAPLPFLEQHHIKIWGHLSQNPKDHLYQYKKNGHEIAFFAMPFFRTYELLNYSKIENPGDREFIEYSLENFITAGTQGVTSKKIFIGHHLFGNYELSGSEQLVSLSGLDSISITLLSDHFDFSLLGHIHKKQTLKTAPLIEYAGAPLPFRFGETGSKQISLYTFTAAEVLKEHNKVPLFRHLLKWEFSLEHWEEELAHAMEKTPASAAPLPAFLDLTIRVDKPVYGLADRARCLLKEGAFELLAFQYKLNTLQSQPEKPASIDYQHMQAEELFTLFYKNKFPEIEHCDKEILEDFTFFYRDKMQQEGNILQ